MMMINVETLVSIHIFNMKKVKCDHFEASEFVEIGSIFKVCSAV